MFAKVAILGSGLMGGSLALALQSKLPQTQAALWARRQEAVDQALELGIHASTDLATIVADADLLVLTTPVGVMADLLEQAIEAGLPKTALITDVGSVKELPHDELEPLVDSRLFIGSHPMVGSEKSGLQAADVELYQGGACLLTIGVSSSESAASSEIKQNLEDFWRTVGCDKIRWMSVNEHDALVAKISHFPHAMASLVAAISIDDSNDASLSGQGLKDTSRVASGDAAMWAEIIQENRQAILPYLEQASRELDQLKSLLEQKDNLGLEAWLQQAKNNRDQIS